MTKEQFDRAIARYTSRVHEHQREYARRLIELEAAVKAQNALVALREADYEHFQLMADNRFKNE